MVKNPYENVLKVLDAVKTKEIYKDETSFILSAKEVGLTNEEFRDILYGLDKKAVVISFPTEVEGEYELICTPHNNMRFEKHYSKIESNVRGNKTTDGDGKGETIITSDTLGNYYYRGKKIIINRNSLSYKIFDILYHNQFPYEYMEYKEIDKRLVARGEPRLLTDKEAKKRIQNALTSRQNGFFSKARIERGILKNELPNGEEIISTIPNVGIRFNNPKI